MSLQSAICTAEAHCDCSRYNKNVTSRFFFLFCYVGQAGLEPVIFLPLPPKCHTSNSSVSGLCPCPLPWSLGTILWSSCARQELPSHSGCFRGRLCSPSKARSRCAAMPIWHHVMCGNPDSGPLARALSIEPSPLLS